MSLGVVEPVTHDPHIGDGEPEEVDRHLLLSAVWLVQQRAGPNRVRLVGGE